MARSRMNKNVKQPQRHWFTGLLIIHLITMFVVTFLLLWFFFHITTEVKLIKRDEGLATDWHPNFNTYLAMKRVYVETMNISNCWVCTAIPTAYGGLLMSAVPLGINATWENLLFDTGTVRSQDKVALHLPITQKGIVCFVKNDTLQVGWSNCNITVSYKCYIKPIDQGTSCSTNYDSYLSLMKTTLRNVQKSPEIYRQFSVIDKKMFHSGLTRISTKVENCYFVCGKKAYKWLPENWSGSCFLGYLVPAIRHTAELPLGKIRNVRDVTHRTENTVRKPTNPVGKIEASWKDHSSVKDKEKLTHMDLSDSVISWAGIFPAYGAVKSIWELRKLSKLLEVMSNATFSALELVTDEMNAIRTVVLQNRMALDFTLAARGGTCALIKEECCAYIPDNQHEINDHLEVIQQVSAMTEPGPNPLTNFFQNLFGGWGSVLMNILIAICVVLLIIGACVCCGIPCVKKLVKDLVDVSVTETMYQDIELNLLIPSESLFEI